MKNLAIARRYAKALLLIGKLDEQTEAYRNELAAVAGLVARERQLEQAIINPLYQSAARRRVLQSMITRLGVSKVMASFLVLLFDKGRFGFLAAINEFYQKLADELKGVVRATVTAAGELPGDAVERMRTALSKRTGKDVILEVEAGSRPDRRGRHANRRSCVGRQHSDAITQHERIFKKG